MVATDKNLRARAAAAAFALLGIPPASQAAPIPAASEIPNTDTWSLDTSFLRYSEAERITVVEPQAALRRDFVENRSLDILVTVDSITGATPLGTAPATANTVPNAVTSPSGGGNPIIGKVPLSHMSDTRYALSTTWQQPVASDLTGSFGADASKETDYLSFGVNSKLARDFNQKDTTLSLGLSPEFDISDPNGGLPVAYSDYGTPGSIHGTRDHKWLASALAGLTQVVNRRTLLQFNYTYTHENGYLNDPYKLLSLVSAAGDPLSAIYENRPRDRNEHSLYWLLKYNIWQDDVFSTGLRIYTDDWGIRSQTWDFTFRRQSNERFYWEPHVRYYHQTSADFYRPALLNTAALPSYASPDLRLSSFDGVSFGLRMGYTLENGSQLVLRAEYYIQSGDDHPDNAIGEQKSYDLFPTLYASILQVEYHFEPSHLFSKTRPGRYE